MSAATDPIIFLLSALGVGGSETKTVRLANSLSARGVDVTIAYLSKPDTLASSVARGVTLINLRRRGRFSTGAVRRLATLIQTRRARTVVAINLYATLYVRLAQLIRAVAGVRFIACLNTSEILPRDRRKMPLYRWTLRRADAVIFGAEGQRRLWRERYRVGAPPQDTAVLYNGVDASRFAPRPKSAARAGTTLSTRLVIGTVARLRPEKAHTDLIRATAALRSQGLDVGVLLVGEGESRAAIEAEISRLELGPYAELAGECDDVRPFLACLDVFVLTSVAVETFSNAALEAMACGLPIVSSEIGGMPELLAYGGGLGYPPGNVALLTERLAALLADADRRTRLGEEARRAVVEHFSWERMVDAFLALLARPISLHARCTGGSPPECRAAGTASSHPAKTET